MNKSVQWILNTLFPIRCLSCGAFQAPDQPPYACRSCLNQIAIRTSSECIGCKTPSPIGQSCWQCNPRWSVDNLLIAGNYQDSLIKALIKTLKYRLVPSAAVPLYIIVRKYLNKLASQKHLNPFSANPLIVPVPLTRHRENWRGFNQAEILARNLSDTFQQEYCDALIRTRQSPPQADLQDRQQRLDNMRNAFQVTHPESVAGRHIIIIDDVCTTGATLNACAEALKTAGAHKVTALVVARNTIMVS